MARPSPDDARQFLARLEKQAAAGAALHAAHTAANRAAYRWGRIDKRTQHFQPAWRSGDAAIYESGDLMHRRTRSEVLNNAQIKHIREALEDLIVGPGMATFADPFDPLIDLTALTPEMLDPLIAYALEADDLYEEYADKEQIDVAGKRSLGDLQRLAIGECVERGGCLLIRSNLAGAGRIVPLAYQIVEYDQLDLSQDRSGGQAPGGTWQNKIVSGIEFDRLGREVAYHVLDEHPHDDFSGGGALGRSRRLRAERVIHVCLYRRPSQGIGVNWLHAVGQTSFDRDKAIGAELQSFAKAALLLLVHYAKNLKTAGNLGLADGGEDDDAYGNEELKMGASPLAFRVQADDEVELIENTRPAAGARDFVDLLDHDTAAGAGLSYYSLTGNYSNTSFTAVRGALLAEDAHIRPLQNWFAAQVALPMRRDFQRQAAALGKLRSVSAAAYVKNPRRYERFDAIGAGRDLLDPEAETNAASGRLRACLTTLKQECARRGQHWIRVLRQVALENRLLDLLDIALDLSKGQGGQAVGNTRSKSDQRKLAAGQAGEADAAARSFAR